MAAWELVGVVHRPIRYASGDTKTCSGDIKHGVGYVHEFVVGIREVFSPECGQKARARPEIKHSGRCRDVRGDEIRGCAVEIIETGDEVFSVWLCSTNQLTSNLISGIVFSERMEKGYARK